MSGVRFRVRRSMVLRRREKEREMNSYSKPRVRVIGVTSILLRGGNMGSEYDFAFRFKMRS